MRRLRDGQAVSLEVESLETNLECLVIAIDGNEATLDPVYQAFSMSVPTTGTNSMLTFEHQGRLVMLRGRVRREDDGLHFAVTDRVTVQQRRRYARVEVALPVLLTPLDAAGAPGGLAQRTPLLGHRGRGPRAAQVLRRAAQTRAARSAAHSLVSRKSYCLLFPEAGLASWHRRPPGGES